MDLFEAAQGCGKAKKDPLPKICHKYPKMMKPDSYTFPKEDPKSIKIMEHNH